MKLVSYILAFYLVLLSAVPCCALDSCPDDTTKQFATHEKGDEDCGNCSPFFNCEGCAPATIACEPGLFGIPALHTAAVYTPYTEHSLPKISYGFWQPPKIG